MNDLVNTMNIFFKKISKGHIQFQLSEQYLLPKKEPMKSKQIKKESKTKVQLTPEEQKNLKKGFKNYQVAKSKEPSFIEKSKSKFDFT